MAGNCFLADFNLHSMGALWSSKSNEWCVFARSSVTNAYLRDPLWTLAPGDCAEACGAFKHEVYKFALHHRDYRSHKSIYLYTGQWRIAKCERVRTEAISKCDSDITPRPIEILVTFRTAELAARWDDTVEKLPPRRWGIQTKRFDATFTKVDGVFFERRYVHLSCSNVGGPI